MGYKRRSNKKGLYRFQKDIFTDFDSFLKDLCNSNDGDYKKSALISYWLNDYKKYLKQEHLLPRGKRIKYNYISYKRGSIIKVNLGFNIGSEQGGLHYCIVLNKNDSIYKPLLNVIPLTSIKPKKRIFHEDLSLGNEIYTKLIEKSEQIALSLDNYMTSIEDISLVLEEIINFTKNYRESIGEYEVGESSTGDVYIEMLNDTISNAAWTEGQLENKYINSLFDDLNKVSNGKKMSMSDLSSLSLQYIRSLKKIFYILENYRNSFKNTNSEILRMKSGSIAQINQMTTVSKLRIHSPKIKDDALYGIRLSDKSLTLIDDKIKELFTF